MNGTSKDSCRYVFKNIPIDTSENSYKDTPQKGEYDKEHHVFHKASKENNIEVTSQTHNQMFKISVNLSKENEKLENIIIDLKDYVKFLENRSKILGEEISSIKREYLNSNKCNSCNSFKNEVTSLQETLGELTKGKDKLDIIMSSQKALFNKNWIGYKPDRSHDKKKFNRLVFKWKFYNNFGHLEPLLYSKLRGLKRNTSSPLKVTTAPGLKMI